MFVVTLSVLMDMFYIGSQLDILEFILSELNNSNFDNATASFYRAFNTVFGRIGRSGSEEVIIELINSKCLPCLLYALETCPVYKTQERSLEFTVNKVLMKVFRTTSMDVLTECRVAAKRPSTKMYTGGLVVGEA